MPARATGSRWLLAAMLWLGALGAIRADVEGELGLPTTRFYSFDEIGTVTRGARIGFDPFGRIAVSRGGACVVLNDTVWSDLVDRRDGSLVMERLVFDAAGEAYYSAFGQWGRGVMSGGRLQPVPLMPADRPKWVLTANLNDIIPLRAGVWFGGLGGAIHWDRASGRHTFFELPSLQKIFALGETLYASTNMQGLNRLDPATGAIIPVRGPDVPRAVIDQAVDFDESRVLLADTEGRLFLFNGTHFTPFPGPLGARTNGRVTALCRLADGHFAISINGNGVYLVAADGRILSALTTPDYHRVTDLAAHENGVLWLVNENGIEKVLYNSALTSFGQRQGLPLSWPQLLRWRGRIVVATSGRLYEAVDGRAGDTLRFQPMSGQPAAAIWALATDGDQLLIGTNQGVFARNEAETGFDPVLAGFDTSRLTWVDGVFFALGTAEVTALRRVDGKWSECAPRIASPGYPLVVHATNHATWVEFGPGRAGRIVLRDGRLQARLFENFPWKAPRWVNIGWAGDTVALSAVPDGRLFFDEVTETFVERPALARLLAAAPYPINRFRQDRDGTIWATHEDGLITIQTRGDRTIVDATTFGRINDRFPFANLLADGDVWLSTGQSLYHVNRNFRAMPRPVYRPRLISLTNGRTSRELLPDTGLPATPPLLPYEDNSLTLRFFAGSYASRQPPAYEFRLHRGDDSRVVVGNGSLLTLADLHEGRYRLEATVAAGQAPTGPPFRFSFEIAAPWYRTWYAYVLYVLGAAGAVFGLLRWSVAHTRSRNVALARLVAERTGELHAAMQQLNEETRNAATLAERDRLAGEIHDSLQQGLSGLMLHLDATLKLAGLTPEVRARLAVARNMVSFTRHEVQHAVWDMETPLLEGTELDEALRKIAALIGPGPAALRITVTGRPVALSPAIKHHLLRIAQEAITNAVRHAAARAITITLAYEPEGVVLSVTDDGNGFVPGEVLASGLGHFGLRGLRGRAGKIGGDLHLESAPGQGTTVRVTVRSPVTAV